MEKASFHLEYHNQKHGWIPLYYNGKNIITNTIEGARRELKNAKNRDKRAYRGIDYRIVKKVTTTEVVS